MPSQEDIDQQLELLATHRRTLAQYLKQQALLSEPFAPPAIGHGIEDARQHIRHIKRTLRAWGVQVEDLPYDEELHEQPGAAEPKSAGRPPRTMRSIALLLAGLGVLGGLSVLAAVLLPSMLASGAALRSDLYWSQCATPPLWVLPAAISPASDAERARSLIAQAIDTKAVETWQMAGMSAPTLGDSAPLDSERQLFLTVSGSGRGKVNIHLFNTAHLIVTTQPGPQHIDVVNISTIDLLSCPSGSGTGTNRTSPTINLIQQAQQYAEDIQYTKDDYLTLGSEASEVLVFPFACRSPGLYTIQVGLRYRDNIRSSAETYLSDKLATIICPSSFTFWPITSFSAVDGSNRQQVQLGAPVHYRWDGASYTQAVES
jgi:hypothetical protein